MKIDDRKNYYMLGLTSSLFFILHRGFKDILILLIILELLAFAIRKLKVFGDGDVNALRWIFYGLGLISYNYLVFFLMWFIFITSIVYLAKRWVFKYSEHTPFFGQLTIMFIVTCLFCGLYMR